MLQKVRSTKKHMQDAPDFRKPRSQVATTQLAIASALGIFAFISFSFLQRQFPKFYAGRKYKVTLPSWPERSLFGWLKVVYKITDTQIIEHAGLDAFVFLSFFKMCIKLLTICAIAGLVVISPVRYRFTGKYDDGDDNVILMGEEEYPEAERGLLWMYVAFTYIFTALTLFLVQRQTKLVVRIRQNFLGRQNSITDRTIRLTGIPPELRDEQLLKEHIEKLKIGKVSSITICREWKPLNSLFTLRHKVLCELEAKYAECPQELRQRESNSTQPADYYPIDGNVFVEEPIVLKDRPTMKTGWLGLFGKEVDAISHLEQQLHVIDEEICAARARNYPATPTAFITMDSVANAQMAAQAVLDPHTDYLISRIAPAPHDIIWDNACLSGRERMSKVYSITVFIGILSLFLVIPVSYLATLLNLKTIAKFWPALGDLLHKHPWLQNTVIGLLPTYIFTFLNMIIPFFYDFLTRHQGFISHSDEELSLVSKNFFYIFVNLFLVFTMAGTASTYWGYLSDTTKIAYQLASSVKEFSLFYVDLIILQGIGMFPFKLLLMGQMIGFPFVRVKCKTPRDYDRLYKPPLFNFGLQLPQPILILIITLIYSVMSTKILISSLLYFIIGFYVYKYQLMYATDHLPHSTGKVWPLMFRRVCLGLLLFHLTMAGTIAGYGDGWKLSSLLIPLPLVTIWVIYNFESKYLPLSFFIALRSIRDFESQSGSSPLRPSEEDDTYEYPFLVSQLDGPMI